MIPEVICDLATSVVLLYCGLMSFRALQSKLSSQDDKQWLTFWLLYSIFVAGTSVVDFVSFVIPFYEEIKLGFVVFLGAFGGAGKIYPLLEPLLLQADEVAKKYEDKDKPSVLDQVKEKLAEAKKE